LHGPPLKTDCNRLQHAYLLTNNSVKRDETRECTI
jgi:hypothetical protein